jgi:hypothetical protein
VSTSPKDAHLFELFCGAIEVGREYVRLAETGKTHIGNHDNWSELLWHENGLPYITYTSQGPKNYADAIQGFYSFLYALNTAEPAPDFSKEPKFLALIEYAKTQPRLREYFLYDKGRDFDATSLHSTVGYILDRYVHVNKITTLERDKLLPVYLPIERHLLDEVLPIVVMVPILFLKFELQQFDINEFIWVEKLSDELQLARGWRGSFGHSEPSLVESAATHGLFISNRSIENKTWFQHWTMQAESYPVEEIDTFFSAIRISSGYSTGYAQMFELPVGWLPRVQRISFPSTARA